MSLRPVDSHISQSDSESESEESYTQGDECEDEEEEEEQEEQNFGSMSMGDLLKLQEDIGTKAFKQMLKGTGRQIHEKASGPFNQKVVKRGEGSGSGNPTRKGNPGQLKHSSKNQPAEVPMMRRAAPLMTSLNPGQRMKKNIIRDPRFDDLSGKLNLKSWQENYTFLRETRKKEKEILKKEVKTEQDPDKKRKMKSIIQRMENQEREQARRDREREIKRAEKQEQMEAFRQGRKPKFMTKKDKKLLMKAAHFEQLKKGSKVEKYLERKEKRLRAKEMKRQHDF